MSKFLMGILVFLTLGSKAFASTDKVAENVSTYLVSIGGEFNEAWAGAESFFLFAGSPMARSCNKVTPISLETAVQCDLAATQMAVYPETRNPFGIFFDRVVLETGTKNRQKLVDLIYIGATENTPGFPDGLEVKLTVRHFAGYPKRQWGTFEIPEWDIVRKVRVKLR